MDLNKVELSVQDSINSTKFQEDENDPTFSFFDGPPFATGLPHYGHILAGTIKDSVCRYMTMKGYHVPRQFGWDCHGLPVECEVDKLLNIKTKSEVTNIKIYNDACRSIVMKCEDDWEKTVHRMGRHVDNFRNSYKTMDFEYMNTVWNVFKTLYDKTLIYQGVKVMPYSTATGTALSNFEAGLNYKDTQDTSIMVAFKLKSQEKQDQQDQDQQEKQEKAEEYIVAWTTTPWTLISNMALCVSPTAQYVKCEYKDKTVIVSKQCALHKKWPILGDPFEGSELAGLKYEPLFPEYALKTNPNTFYIVSDSYVTVSEDTSAFHGTGVVHLAPAFGEDDYRVCFQEAIINKHDPMTTVLCPVDENGKFNTSITKWSGKYVKDKQVEKEIIAHLKSLGSIIDISSHTHSYPFCYRTDTPLIYKMVSSWFVHVEKPELKQSILKNSEKIHWYPNHIKEKRFHNWLENARDWAVSRKRFWGTPLPVWISEDGQEIVVVGSAKELQELANLEEPLTDLHRDTIDHITIPSSRPNHPPLRRIEEVFDCWFESGCMPVVRGQSHKNKTGFKPADFVAEGIDQTRGWFYTTLVITSALYNAPPFKNVICNGHILAQDGKKMSKRLKNYPDPMDVINKYGADALRLYLLSSPAVKGEAIRFQEKGVEEMARTILVPIHNALRFYKQACELIKLNTNSSQIYIQPCMENNFMDHWILNYMSDVITTISKNMAKYQLSPPIHEIRTFVDRLNNMYIRMNRSRIKQGNIQTLESVLIHIAKMIAPFAPFHAEYLYRALCADTISIHQSLYPSQLSLTNEELSIISMMDVCNDIIELVRNHRTKMKRPIRLPIQKMTIVYGNQEIIQAMSEDMKTVLEEELNVKEIHFSINIEKYMKDKYILHLPTVGSRLGSDMRNVVKELETIQHENTLSFTKELFPIHIHGHILQESDFIHTYSLFPEYEKKDTISVATTSSIVPIPVLIEVDHTMTPELLRDGTIRDLIRQINDARKDAKVQEHQNAHVIIQYNPTITSYITDDIKEKLQQSGKTGQGTLEFQIIEDSYISIQKQDDIQISVYPY